MSGGLWARGRRGMEEMKAGVCMIDRVCCVRWFVVVMEQKG